MRRERLLKAFIFIIFTVLILGGANAGAQFGYYGPFGPYYGGPFSYGYPLFLGSAPFFPPPPAPFRGAHVLLSSLLGLPTPSPSTVPVLTTVPAVTPAGFSVTTLVPTAPSTVTITLPLSALVAPVTTAPVVAPVPTTTVPGLTTAILLGGGGSLTTLATLGLLPTVTTPTLTTPVVPTVPVATTTVPGITTAILLGGGGISTTSLLLLGI